MSQLLTYNSGNISSVINSFKEVAKDKVKIEVTSDLATIKTSGQGCITRTRIF